uniref:Axin-1 n=1 Tax=Pyxicephalus adspersus TaxID=30357 RepID=A0AAV3ABI9_PYXAD|nr:TPA: hypothetical protein GDO54_015102 [Pyxicephalus adspersus]
MSVQGKGFPLDLGGSFTEDAPRPPVPGEEGELVTGDPRPFIHSYCTAKTDGIKNETSTATPRRSDLDLGYEPEGSASPTPPYLKWAESLHSLLDDQDGINLFRTFLQQENCGDLLDFWFACSGFRKLEPSDSKVEKRLKLAKAIYKKYILDNNAIVSRQIKPATKSFIKDCVLRQQIEPDMFDQAQMEIQSMMEDNTYPVFLKSDIYLEYTTLGGESPKICSDHSSGSGTGKGPAGYLPTLNEDEEWKCDQAVDDDCERESVSSNRINQKLILEAASHCPAPPRRLSDGREFRPGTWREPVNPYYVNTGYAVAPATSANDSEQQSMSSDADTMSLTDSSVDGVPPYRLRKHHRREMQESAKANGRVPLPHIPRTYHMPKDIHVDPEKFAAELISRLEGVLRDREAEQKLEERLKRVRAEEEGDDADVSSAPSMVSHNANYEMPVVPEDAERNQKIMQWIMEGEKEISRHKKSVHSSSGAKKQPSHDVPRPLSIERPGAVHPWVSAQLRNVVQPSHPFVQDPTMPPNPAPNPLTQLEEARRRLEEEEKKAGKMQVKQRLKPQKKGAGGSSQPCDNIVVAYYFCGEPIPYRTMVKGRVVTLGQFKELLTKKGNYRYYFKKVSDEFDCGVVFEEVRDEDTILPIYEEKIIGKVEKID